MRALLLVLLLLAPAGLAQPAGIQATMDIEVGADHAETMTLSFSGLRRLTTYQGICLPERARETRVYDEVGDVQYEAKEEDGRRIISFLARSDVVHVDLARAASPAADAPLHTGDVNFCVPSGSRTTVNVRVAEGSALFFLSDGGRVDGRAGSVTRDGPIHVFYSYEAPLAADLAAFEEGPFRVLVAPALAGEAREVARLARGPFEAAAAEAGLAMPFPVLRVRYAAATPHSWEAGHYNGKGYVIVKEDVLQNDTTLGYPYTPVKVLVHEAFHALSFPYGKGRVNDTVSWWLEGTARHAERHVDVAMPNASRACRTESVQVRCWDFDDRIRRAELDAAYAPGFAFDTRWEPSLPQDDDTRRFYYGMSEVVVAAWIERHGEAAYQGAWARLVAGFNDAEGCPCEDGWLLDVLDEAAGGRDADMFAPWANLRASDMAAFEARVAPHVKDEAALERELQARTKAAILPSAWWGVVAALAIAAFSRKARP